MGTEEEIVRIQTKHSYRNREEKGENREYE